MKTNKPAKQTITPLRSPTKGQHAQTPTHKSQNCPTAKATPPKRGTRTFTRWKQKQIKASNTQPPTIAKDNHLRNQPNVINVQLQLQLQHQIGKGKNTLWSEQHKQHNANRAPNNRTQRSHATPQPQTLKNAPNQTSSPTIITNPPTAPSSTQFANDNNM